MKIVKFILSASALLMSSISNAAWIDWTSTTNGTLDIGGSIVNVTMTGNPMDLIDGDYYYNNSRTGGTSLGGTYAGLEPSDLIRVTGTGDFTLSFDQTISNLDMALVSVGRTYMPVTYDFSDSFTVLTDGDNYWGDGWHNVSGDNFTGYEYNGVIEFAGAFDSISFNVGQSEYWHGFNFGAESVSVPEPSIFALMGAGLFGFGFARRRATRK